MKINKIVTLLLGCLIISGCDKQSGTAQIDPLKEGDYTYMLPYVKSSTEVTHSKYGSNKQDIFNMGELALQLAKPYFDTKNTFATEGQILSSSELERFDSKYRGLGLLKYKTDYNPEGLNPEKGSYVQSGTGIDMYNPILVSDVHEIDFVDENGEFVGFQFIIVLNENVTYYEADKNEDGSIKKDENGEVVLKKDSKTTQISAQQLYNYGSIEAGNRLVSYLRNNHPEVGNLPIQVLLYKTASSDSKLYGTFIGQSYITTRASTTYEKINQEWVFAPSTRLENLNTLLASQISNVKSQIFEYFPNEVGFYGRIFFEDNIAQKVEIEINMRAKTYVETQSLIQYVKSLASSINENKPELKIHVLSDGETIAILTREKDSETITVTPL